MSIPSPSNGVWHLGPVPIRGYALAIILGIVAAIWIGERRWAARGGRAGEVQDLAVWAVPFGLVGGRLYHVATDHQRYFGADGDPWQILYVWHGGLGRLGLDRPRRGRRDHRRPQEGHPDLADGRRPGPRAARRPGDRPLGQLVQPGAVRQAHRPALGARDRPPLPAARLRDESTFHPTFLYECVWNLFVFAVLIALDRRFKLGHGRMLALYVMGYTLGRGWIEMLRIDTVELNDVDGLRFNVWTSIVLFLVAAAWFLVSLRLWPGQEESVYVEGRGPDRDRRRDPDRGCPWTSARLSTTRKHVPDHRPAA